MEYHIFWISSISFLFRIVNSIPDCKNVYITNHEGIITSPSYPSKYPDFTSCSWYIDIPKNATLSISVLDLSIESDIARDCDSSDESCCLRNWLSLPESAATTKSRASRLLCGNHPVPSFELPDTLKIASIKFHSSKNLKGGRGFKLKYAVIPNKPIRCTNSEFTCTNGQQCIDNIRQCDGIKDCEDQSDENNCALKCTAQGLLSCPDTPYRCYNSTSRACAKLVLCPATADVEWISCKDGSSCFRGDQLCDKTINCDDQSDEANCKPSTPPSQDADVFFMCDNWKWVRSIKVCDGNDDCGDHSDEDGCIRPSLETAIILGCLSCSLLFILLASYIFHAHHQHYRGAQQTNLIPPHRPLLNINNQPYIMPFREPPPPYPLDPPPNRRRYRRHRRHTRLAGSPAPVSPQAPAPLNECSESLPQEQAAACAWKAPEEQNEGATSTD